jgi:hypothetical protein
VGLGFWVGVGEGVGGGVRVGEGVGVGKIFFILDIMNLEILLIWNIGCFELSSK